MENVIIEKYAKLVSTAMKNREKDLLETYKMVKNVMFNYTKQEGTPVLDEDAELNILLKIAKELNGDIEDRRKANRLDLIPDIEKQLNIVNGLLPKPATAEDIDAEIAKYVANNGAFDNKSMGKVIGYVKGQFKNVDGSLVSKRVLAYIKSNA